MASLKQIFNKLRKELPQDRREDFDWMVRTSVDMEAKNTANFASKDLAELQLQQLADKLKSKE